MSQSPQTEYQTVERDSNDSLVLTAGETARLLRLSKTTVYDQIRQGSIPSIRIGKRILIPKAALMHKLEEAMGKVG